MPESPAEFSHLQDDQGHIIHLPDKSLARLRWTLADVVLELELEELLDERLPDTHNEV